MKRKSKINFLISSLSLLLCLLLISLGFSLDSEENQTLDEKVRNFLESHRYKWRDMNVPKLKGPFDFVFCDADKDWYKNYLIAVLPKLEVGGCFTAHNVSGRRGWRRGGIGEFVDYLESLPNLETTFDRSSRAGISISYKISDK